MRLAQDQLTVQINGFLGQTLRMTEDSFLYWHLLTCDPGTGEQL